MTRFLLRRALWGLVTLFVFVTIMFFAVQALLPGDFVDQFALAMGAEERESMRQVLGLELPLWQQYLNWLRGLVRGDLGKSYYGVSIGDALKSALPPTLLVFLTGTGIAFVIGLWLGKVTAWRGRGLLMNAVSFSGIALYTSFPPWLAFLLAYAFGRRLSLFRGVFGLGGFQDLPREIWLDSPVSPTAVTTYMVLTLAIGALILAGLNAALQRLARRRIRTPIAIPLLAAGAIGSWYGLGFGPQGLDMLRLASLPIATYTLLSFGETMLVMRTSMTDTLNEDYVAVARAKGLPEHIMRDKHAARNAILPVLSRLVITLPYLFTGIVIIEDTLAWPGVGRVLWTALYWQDMPLVLGVLLIVGALSLVSRLVLDVLYAYIDPRIRFSKG